MFVVSGGRGIGKTRTLLERVKSEDAIVVCEDTIEMRERAYSYGITGLNLITYEEYCKLDSQTIGKPVYIVDTNKLLLHINSNTKGYTISNN